jgi:putative ABC transport system permease protein
MLLTSMLAVTASVLAAGLLVASRAPFDHGFAAQHGAHLTAQFDATKVTSAQVEATAKLAGVTATAGPYPVLSVRPTFASSPAAPDPGLAPVPGVAPAPVPGVAPPPIAPDGQGPPLSIVGRTGPGGALDDLVVTDGRWATGSGEIVMNGFNLPFRVGDKLSIGDAPGSPVLTVVGLARSMTNTADAWMQPAALTALGTRPDFQMLYRFAAAATDAEVAADRATVAGAVPAGALRGASSYLKTKLAAERESATFVPFVVAFGVLGLAMSVLIIGVVVSGAVGSATRRIGILKALGFTPAQVVRAYVAQALIPAVVGSGLGVLLGNLLAVPVLAEAQDAYNTGGLVVAPWLDVVVPAVALTTAALAALLPAMRAGRLRSVDALAVGRTPRTGRGRRASHLLGRLPLPRAVSIGLAGPFTRPARALTLAAAVVLGTTGVTFGVGLAVSLAAIQDGANGDHPGDVAVQTLGGPGAGGSAPSVIAAKIRAQAGTRRWFGTGETAVSVPGLAGPTSLIAYQGDSSWGTYQMVAGRWFSGPGEAVVPSGFLNATGTRIGDRITLSGPRHDSTVRIVGEVFDLHDEGMQILTDVSSLDAGTAPEMSQFDIELTSGTDETSYVRSLNEILQPLGSAAAPQSAEVSSTIVAMDALAGVLTLMLVTVAGLGVLNTVLLDTRERVHDLGVFKALGMAPRQTITMILFSVGGTGLVAGLLGVWIGTVMHGYILPMMGTAAGSRIPPADLAVFHPATVLLLCLGGLVIVTAGALPPAGWAARTRTAVALRTE